MNQTADQPQIQSAAPRQYTGQQSFARRGTGKEPYEVILRRFNREVMQSGLMTEVKKRRFREKDLSREIRRHIALVKAQRRKTKRGY